MKTRFLLPLLFGFAVLASASPEVETFNNAAFALLKELHRQNPEGNVLFSPYSLGAVLGTAHHGAAGETARALETVVGLPPDSAAFFGEIGKDYGTMPIANAIWLSANIHLLPEFEESIRSHYNTKFFHFADTPEKTAADINTFVTKQSRGLIRNFHVAVPSSDAGMFLVNTIYLKATWKVFFQASQTKPGQFRLGTGEVQERPLMHNDLAAYCTEDDQAKLQILRLAYTSPRFEFVAVLPAPEVPIDTALDRLVNGGLTQWLGSMRLEERVILTLPKFRLNFESDLAETYCNLGMRQPFDAFFADFPGISDKRLYLRSIQHLARMECDEKGTTAFAATAAEMDLLLCGSPEPPKPYIFRANRPFVALVRDTKTEVILFAGIVNDPDQWYPGRKP